MAMICVGSISAAPGVTTLSVLLAASWPRPAVLVEADPSGGVLAVRYRLGRTPGLSGLAAVVRQGAAPPEALQAHAQVLPGDQPVVVAPESGPVTHSILTDAAHALADWCRSLEGVDVIIDCGRLAVRDVTWPLWAASDELLLVSRPRADELYPVAHRYKALDRHVPLLGLVLVGDRPYKAEEVAVQLGLPVRGVVADDARAAGVLSRGGSGRTLRRSPLVRSMRALAEDLAAHHDVPAMPEEAVLPAGDLRAGELPAGGRVARGDSDRDREGRPVDQRRRPGRSADRTGGGRVPPMASPGDRAATAGARLPTGPPPDRPATRPPPPRSPFPAAPVDPPAGPPTDAAAPPPAFPAGLADPPDSTVLRPAPPVPHQETTTEEPATEDPSGLPPGYEETVAAVANTDEHPADSPVPGQADREGGGAGDEPPLPLPPPPPLPPGAAARPPAAPDRDLDAFVASAERLSARAEERAEEVGKYGPPVPVELLERARVMLSDGASNDAVAAHPADGYGPEDGEPLPSLPRREPGDALEAEQVAAQEQAERTNQMPVPAPGHDPGRDQELVFEAAGPERDRERGDTDSG